jgi:hypothetical protein
MQKTNPGIKEKHILDGTGKTQRYIKKQLLSLVRHWEMLGFSGKSSNLKYLKQRQTMTFENLANYLTEKRI